MVRIRHQADALEQGASLNNYIEPERFSSSERHNLKEAFQVLSNGQISLAIPISFKGPLLAMKNLKKQPENRVPGLVR